MMSTRAGRLLSFTRLDGALKYDDKDGIGGKVFKGGSQNEVNEKDATCG